MAARNEGPAIERASALRFSGLRDHRRDAMSSQRVKSKAASLHRTMRRLLISTLVLVGVAASPAYASAQALPLAVARHAIRTWVRDQARTEPRENGAVLVGVRASSCQRRSRRDVVCDGVSRWSNHRPHGTRFICLIPRLSAVLAGGAVRVHQIGFKEVRCGPSLHIDEEAVGIVH
jgi:hypothetical protein